MLEGVLKISVYGGVIGSKWFLLVSFFIVRSIRK